MDDKLAEGARMPGRAYWLGWLLCGLAIAFLLLDAVMKLLALPNVLEAGATLGFDGKAVERLLGGILLVCTLLYALPRTAVLGAILLTAYLGGAIAVQLRIGSPMFSHILFGVYLGVFVWGGLYLRDNRLRRLIPVARTETGA
jgi:hypothetical protein